MRSFGFIIVEFFFSWVLTLFKSRTSQKAKFLLCVDVKVKKKDTWGPEYDGKCFISTAGRGGILHNRLNVRCMIYNLKHRLHHYSFKSVS